MKKKPTLKHLTEWLDADYNRSAQITPTHTGYQCQLQFVSQSSGKRMFGLSWTGDTVDKAITEAISAREWEDA